MGMMMIGPVALTVQVVGEVATIAVLRKKENNRERHQETRHGALGQQSHKLVSAC